MARKRPQRRICLCVRTKDDKGGKEFYFLGEMHPTGEFKAIKTKAATTPSEIEYELNAPVRQDIYEFMLQRS